MRACEGIVKGSKGAQGGYRLNVVPGELTVSEILEALDGSYRIEKEEIPEDIHGRGIALSIQELIIDRLNTQMEQVLKNVTLEDLQKNYQDSKLYNQDMYYI